MAKFRLGLQVSPFQAHYITGEKASGLGNVLVGPAGVDHEPIHATMQQLTTTNTIPLAQPSPARGGSPRCQLELFGVLSFTEDRAERWSRALGVPYVRQASAFISNVCGDTPAGQVCAVDVDRRPPTSPVDMLACTLLR